MSSIDCFFQLIQLAVGNKSLDKLELTEEQWRVCFRIAKEQAILGVLFPVAQKYLRNETGQRYEPLFGEWLGTTIQIQEQNRLANKLAERLSQITKEWGYKGCVLKGQGVAMLYPEPMCRQSGDIDLWIDGEHDSFIDEVKKHHIRINNIDYVHSGMSFFEDIKTEIHFRPSWMYNPLSNKRLQSFFEKVKVSQFSNFDKKIGFAYPTIQFNIVYSLIHINRHIFEEGIGLRQLMDYYYILQHSTKEEREQAFFILESLRLKKFTSAVMYVMLFVFKLNENLLLCSPNKKEGVFLLKEIMRGGNFGRYDDRNKWFDKGEMLKKNLFNIKRNLRYLRHYPSEVMCIPFWKIWHWSWRKRRGYL